MSAVVFDRKDPALGAKLREARKSRGLLLRELEDLSGVSANSICAYEHGQAVPLGVTLERICEGLAKKPALTQEELAKIEAAADARRRDALKKAQQKHAKDPSIRERSGQTVSEKYWAKKALREVLLEVASGASEPTDERLTAIAKKAIREDAGVYKRSIAASLGSVAARVTKLEDKLRHGIPAAPTGEAPKARRTSKGIRIERVQETAREEAMDLYEDRIKLLETALEAQAETIAKLELAMRKKGWL